MRPLGRKSSTSSVIRRHVVRSFCLRPFERAPPKIDDPGTERTECPNVSWHCVVCEVAGDNQPQPMPLAHQKPRPHLRNGLVCPAFALYVTARGHVPTESSRCQKSGGASKGPVHKERIGTVGGRLGPAR